MLYKHVFVMRLNDPGSALVRRGIFSEIFIILLNHDYISDPQSGKNVQSGMCAQWKFRSSCADAQSSQCTRFPSVETLAPWPSKCRANTDLLPFLVLRRISGACNCAV